MRSCYLHPPICAVPSLAYVHTRGWRQNLAWQTCQGCQFICGTLVVKRKKKINSICFKGLFFYDIILTKISVRLLPCRRRSFDWFVPGHLGLSADLFAVVCEIQQGLLRKYLIKLAFGRDPGVITHRTVCIVVHKRAQKRHVTKQGVWLLPRASHSNCILHIWKELKHSNGTTRVIKTF